MISVATSFDDYNDDDNYDDDDGDDDYDKVYRSIAKYVMYIVYI